MTNKESCKTICDLIQLDIDAIHAYNTAIDHVEHSDVKLQLEEYRQDHHDHVEELSDEVRKLGGEPPEFSRDFKGFLIQGFTAVRSSTGTEGALKAMKSNEETTNKKYSEALEETNLSPELLTLIRKNKEDERRHLEYIENALEMEIWKSDGEKQAVNA